MKKNNIKQCARSLYDALTRADLSTRKQIIKKFTDFVAQKQYFGPARRVISEMEKFVNANTRQMEIITARDFDEKTIKKIFKGMENKYKITARADAELIGGAIVRLGDRVFDASIKKQLKNLANSIK